MTRSVTKKTTHPAKQVAKRVVKLASTHTVLKTHGHTLSSATKLKDRLDRKLAHAAGK